MDDPNASVTELVGEMTRAEKLSLVHGASDPEGTATGYVPGVERLGIPPLRLVDGPLGVRAGGFEEPLPATAFPSTLALAATFDPGMAREYGTALGREARARGQDAVLAPGMNLLRVPHCGRNFEYYSEDPALAARFAAGAVEGIQSADVIATAKHYVANNQETDRTSVSAEVDERTLRECYLPAFRAAVEAGAGSVMTAYNRVNGTHMSDHRRLLRGVLKGEWGFEGYVVSDWYGTESTAGAANAGLDLEMPGVPAPALFDGDDGDGDGERGDGGAGGGSDEGEAPGGPPLGEMDLPGGMPDPTKAGLFGAPLGDAVEAGEVPPERLDDMVARILGEMERVGMLGGNRGDGALDTSEHRALAERIAARGAVLLENDGVLPLDDGTDVAVIGPGIREPLLGGGGSSETTPLRSTSPADGLAARAEGDVTPARGIPAIEAVSLFDLLPFGEEEEGETGAEEPGDAGADPEPSLDGAVEAAESADAAVVFVRDAATEGLDREDLRLPGEQDELVEAVAAANDRTVVVANTSGPVELPWREDVAALLAGWYPGQAHGDAVASVLYGDRDASGRLPVTFAPASAYPTAPPERFPGVDGEAQYGEGVFVGYRHFDAADADPTYPFGHGLSYAAFEYGDAEALDDSTVGVTVENGSDRAGREVVQAYVRPPAAPDGVDRPVRELAGFAAVDVGAGAERAVEISLDERALSRYDPDAGWTTDSGAYAVEIGRSARDPRVEVEIRR